MPPEPTPLPVDPALAAYVERIEELKALLSRVEAVLERFCRLLEVERSQRAILDLPVPTRRSDVN
jgi:hypothetical protein